MREAWVAGSLPKPDQAKTQDPIFKK
jgi:hypothetical protein